MKSNSLVIKVRVKKKHIDAGCASDTENCPVAIATQEAVLEFFKKNKLGRLFSPFLKVRTDVEGGAALGVSLFLEEDDISPSINLVGLFDFRVSTSAMRKQIDGFITSFDTRGKLLLQLKEALAFKWAYLDEVLPLRKDISSYRKEIRPFTFNLIMEANN